MFDLRVASVPKDCLRQYGLAGEMSTMRATSFIQQLRVFRP